MDIINIKGIGPKKAALFNKLGIYDTKDLLTYYPRAYEEFKAPKRVKDINVGENASVILKIKKVLDIKKIRSLVVVSTVAVDEMYNPIKLVWFNCAFLRSTLKPGETYVFKGKVSNDGALKKIEHPAIFEIYEYKKLINVKQPVYALTKGLDLKTVRKAVEEAFAVEKLDLEYMPESIRNKYDLVDLNTAHKLIHFPANDDDLSKGYKRLIFDEFFIFIMATRRLKSLNEDIDSDMVIDEFKEVDNVISNLEFTLTNAQLKAWEDIKRDLSSGKVMNRLVQGDVGCGKTVIAELALMSVVMKGYQGALMAPTEVLATQHYEGFSELINKIGLDIKHELLTGSTTQAQKKKIYERLKNGEIDILIGTHALFQEKVEYKNLALVITDEQHRFGVKQREALGNKGGKPHVLVMSATPIPRTLAIILYGELSVSNIDEMPSNRIPIKNCVVDISYRPNAYKFINNQIKEGRQAYIICPMVEESEGLELENVKDYAKRLKEIYPPSVNIDILHGKMKPKQKDEIMKAFAEGKINILVSTTVVEVGVNVPNASVMMIENAERFGLASLHQLRGRVGRGKYQSYCIFMNTSDSKTAKERLDILNESNDGFVIANKDLKLRGQGDMFGTRQSGEMYFKLGDIIENSDILLMAVELSEEYMIKISKVKVDHYFENEEEKQVFIQKVENQIKSCIETICL